LLHAPENVVKNEIDKYCSLSDQQETILNFIKLYKNPNREYIEKFL
jgi:hypothetical protein